MTILEVAQSYWQRGLAVIPIPHRSKKALLDGWPQLRLSLEELPHHFNGHPQNIGVLLGEPSGWLIDVDLDHLLAIELADQHLPPTALIFGRSGKPRSHRLFRVTGPVATKKHKSKSAGMIVELRSTGAQTVFPPSVHESGEPIEWEDSEAEAAAIDPEELLKAVERLATAVLVRLGEKRSRREQHPAEPVGQTESAATVTTDQRMRRCLDAMLRMDMADTRDGSGRLFAAACRCVEHDLNEAQSLAVIRDYAAQKTFPRDWTDEEILRRLTDAERRCERGVALRVQVDEQGLVRLGTRDPASGKLVLSPRKTLPTARAYVADFHHHFDGRTIAHYASLFMVWQGNCYRVLEDSQLCNRVFPWLHEAARYIQDRSTGEFQLVDFDANPATVRGAITTLQAHVHLSAGITPPEWLVSDSALPPVDEILPCRSFLLHLPTGRQLEPTPSFFNTCALNFDPDPHAALPRLWLEFLHQLLPGDEQALDLLQEWFGYCLTGDTSQQKMLLVVGPRRGGKGTIARVLRRLVGAENVCGPTTGSLTGPFGLQPLLGKTLAIVSDARFSGDNISTVVERLLCISGEDTLTVDRKFMTAVTLKLPTRFVFLSNELPRLTDASGALAGRFLLLRLTESFYGREDTQLTRKLNAELPGILNWAIEGWHRLRSRGYFVMPTSAQTAVQQMEDLASPVGAFVREECIVDPGLRVYIDELYEAWKDYCQRDGRVAVGTRQTFGRDLQAVVPSLLTRRNQTQGRFYEGIGLQSRGQGCGDAAV